MRIEELRLIGNFAFFSNGEFGKGVVCGERESEAMEAEFRIECDSITGGHHTIIQLPHAFTVAAFNRGVTFDPCSILARYYEEAEAFKEDVLRKVEEKQLSEKSKKRVEKVMAKLNTFGYKETTGLSETMQPGQYKNCASNFVRVCTNKGDVVIDGAREAANGEIILQVMTEFPLDKLIMIIALKD